VGFLASATSQNDVARYGVVVPNRLHEYPDSTTYFVRHAKGLADEVCGTFAQESKPDLVERHTRIATTLEYAIEGS